MFQSLFINESAMILFVLILLRISSFILSSAIFHSMQLPTPVKVLFSLCITMLVYESNKNKELPLDGLLVLYSLKEVFIGLALGLLTRSFFHAIAMGSELVSMSLGLGAASVFNPISGISSSLIEQFQGVLAVLVFFSLQGHHLLLGGINQSFEFLPVTALQIKLLGFSEFVFWCKNLFEIGLKIAAPVLSSIFLVNLSMGILGRAVPQINVFVTSFQVTILVGFLVVFISLPLFLNEMIQILDMTHTEMFKFMRSF